MTFHGTNIIKIATQTLQGWRSLVKPYIITTVAIGSSVTTGDLICQYLESHKKGPDGKRNIPPSSSILSWWDRERSRIMCTTAVLVSTPWSFTLARIVERLFPGKRGIQIAKKILTNTLLAPINISLVFTAIILLQGHSLRTARTKIKNDMPKTFVIGSFYWPFISFINFRFIPLDYRPIIGSIAGALWNIYVSSAANNPKLNPDGSIKASAGPAPTLLAETSGTGVPALQEAWKTVDQNKKDL
ncbi:unnamed protein product [Adineta steineri]|uniref:Mitochondrial inner membrane protein Mpv17 n=1 Tax=Adineta steineri TaxID=433720 RepID=A0A815I1X3_9BILA|nr:unnamed protein product [Adineta steineri]CAF3986048.1 unnamed protein product [Adineta steineri]